MPEQFDTAPDFTLPHALSHALSRDVGTDICLSNLQGGAVVLFFYPRDDTPGCTKESIGFSERLQEFADAGAQVFGISKDSIASHVKFSTKHALNVGLLSDENRTVCEDYDVWHEKSMYGRTFMGIVRTTFLIGADGIIAQIWHKVKVAGHVDEVLDAVKSL